MLLNLLGNAVKFTVVGAVDLTVIVADSDDVTKRNITITIKDTGIGKSHHWR